MESDNLGQAGQMDLHTSPNALYSRGRAIPTTSPSQGNEVHFFGMDMLTG